ncbi:MAG TPA: hypothetical protein VN719_09420 [Gemmatimonadales bacterium]|nr:hypothetical protein [Gemmatimonadales bacterium]
MCTFLLELEVLEDLADGRSTELKAAAELAQGEPLAPGKTDQ